MIYFNALLHRVFAAFQHAHLINMIPVVATWLTFVVAAWLSYFWQARHLNQPIYLKSFCVAVLPPEAFKSRSFRIDIVIYIGSRVMRGLMAVGDSAITLTVAYFLQSLLKAFLPMTVAKEPDNIVFVIWSIVLFIVVDFANFVSHFLQHKVGFLWELHKVHHSATVLTPITTSRVNPLGDKFDHLVAATVNGIPAGVAMYFFDFRALDIGVMVATVNLFASILNLDSLRHSNYQISFGWFDRVFISPHMHQLHHSAQFEDWDINLGNKLAVWDWIFGTAKIPAKGEKIHFGIGRGSHYDAEYTTLYGAYVRPVINMFRVMVGRGAPLPEPTMVATKTDEAAVSREGDEA